MIIKIDELRISTEKAFKSIFAKASGMQKLAEKPKNRILLKSFGIDPRNFTPVIAEEISIEQWVRILQIYSKKWKYTPASNILTGLKEIIKE